MADMAILSQTKRSITTFSINRLIDNHISKFHWPHTQKLELLYLIHDLTPVVPSFESQSPALPASSQARNLVFFVLTDHSLTSFSFSILIPNFCATLIVEIAGLSPFLKSSHLIRFSPEFKGKDKSIPITNNLNPKEIVLNW